MEKKIIGLLIIIFSISWVIMYVGNLETIVSIEKNTKDKRGTISLTETHYCKSGNYYVIHEASSYLKYSENGVLIEKGKVINGEFLPEYKGKYITMDMILALIIILVTAFILIWMYSKEFSFIQSIKDYFNRKKQIPYSQLSLSEQKEISCKNPCINCKDQPQLIFQEEIHNKKWGIIHIHFHCKQCNQSIRLRRK